ncbi:MAG TPA: helix-turn-helix domain-containing protein [Candidatus Micrarchaeaceae archaeon]|nr:helix-turn-helix domain-containing protein [Candidatus Micrarchaeaceae archaeon]
MSNDNDIATPSADRLAWRVAEVAQLTGLGETTLWAEIRAGRLPVARISARCTVVRAADLEAYLERAARPPEVPAGPAPRGRRGR